MSSRKSLVFSTFTPVVRPHFGDQHPRYQLPVVGWVDTPGRSRTGPLGLGTSSQRVGLVWSKPWLPERQDRREITEKLARRIEGRAYHLHFKTSFSPYFPVCVHSSPTASSWHLPALKAQLQWSFFRDTFLVSSTQWELTSFLLNIIWISILKVAVAALCDKFLKIYVYIPQFTWLFL